MPPEGTRATGPSAVCDFHAWAFSPGILGAVSEPPAFLTQEDEGDKDNFRFSSVKRIEPLGST